MKILFTALLVACILSSASAAIPDSSRQLIVATTDSWDTTTGTLQRYEKRGGRWQTVGKSVPVLFGRSGLAWGVGVAGQEQSGNKKVEGDRRAPAGIFRIGRAYGDAPSLPGRRDYPYHQVTEIDCWIENPEHPQYNQHVQIDPANPPPWFKREQMKQSDPAHKWKLEIRHNADPPVAGRGSAIFFHIWRGPNRPSAGCTTMRESDLLEILAWIRADADPHYVLLPTEEYTRLQRAWHLPPLAN